jgi:hypothetical protein
MAVQIYAVVIVAFERDIASPFAAVRHYANNFLLRRVHPKKQGDIDAVRSAPTARPVRAAIKRHKRDTNEFWSI